MFGEVQILISWYMYFVKRKQGMFIIIKIIKIIYIHIYSYMCVCVCEYIKSMTYGLQK